MYATLQVFASQRIQRPLEACNSSLETVTIVALNSNNTGLAISGKKMMQHVELDGLTNVAEQLTEGRGDGSVPCENVEQRSLRSVSLRDSVSVVNANVPVSFPAANTHNSSSK